jgi:citrate lyase beta subunit
MPSRSPKPLTGLSRSPLGWKTTRRPRRRKDVWRNGVALCPLAHGQCRARRARAGHRFSVWRRADNDGLLRWGEASRAMGFEGMGCIHPIQIEIIHRAFAPTASELEKALNIVAAYEDAQAHGLGVVSLGSKMIDAPVVQRALKLVARAKQMGLMVGEES